MPMTIDAEAVLAWFTVGLMLGLGWTLGVWTMSRLLAAI